MNNSPAIGRIVHYTPDGIHRVPAIITAIVDRHMVTLTVFDTDSTEAGVPGRFEPEGQIGAGHDTAGTWCWPVLR